MMKRFTTYLCYVLSASALLSACNRPIAYYQQGPVVHYPTSRSTSTVVTDNDPVKQAAGVAALTAPVVLPYAMTVQPTNVVEQLSAYARNDTKLTSDKRFSKRVSRLKNLLSESAAKENLSSTEAHHKTTILERLMLKKINKKINKQLSPDQSKKTMINGGLLSGSLILLIGGILLLLLTSGTAAVIGLIAAIVGALGIIFGLIAS